MRTWKVIKWDNKPEHLKTIELACRHCGQEAEVEADAVAASHIIAIIGGMGFIFDPAGYHPEDNWMPNEIQCRKCRRIYTDEPKPQEV